jgi:hypothetical protein
MFYFPHRPPFTAQSHGRQTLTLKEFPGNKSSLAGKERMPLIV